MNIRDLYWLVGILEGEGTFYLAQPLKRYPRYFYPRIKVGMTDRDVVARIAAIVDSHVLGPYANKSGNLPIYTCQIGGKRAVRLMRRIEPLMGKRRRARIRQLLREAS